MNNEFSGEPAGMHNLVRAFVACTHIVGVEMKARPNIRPLAPLDSFACMLKE